MEQPRTEVRDIRELIGESKAQELQKPTAEEVLQKINNTPEKVEETTSTEEVEKTESTDVVVEEKKEEEVKTPKPKKKEVTNYTSKLRGLIEDGFVQDIAVEVPQEDGTTKPVFLSELELEDAGAYQEIITNYKQYEAKTKDENFVSVEGLDDNIKKLIEVKKAGGNVEELIKQEVQYIDVLTRLKENLSDEQEQINVVYHELKANKLSDKVIKAQIEDYIENLELESMATEIVDREIKKYEDSLEEKKKLELDRVAQEKEAEKTFKKLITTTAKELQLTETAQKRLVENSTKKDEQGLTNTDKLYFDSIKDPKKHLKVAYLLDNIEDFEKWISSGKVTKAKTDVITPIFTFNPNATRIRTTPAVEDKTSGILDKIKQT